ncbi:hypothetical protein D3C81_1579710 [compost metagenome]
MRHQQRHGAAVPIGPDRGAPQRQHVVRQGGGGHHAGQQRRETMPGPDRAGHARIVAAVVRGAGLQRAGQRACRRRAECVERIDGDVRGHGRAGHHGFGVVAQRARKQFKQ